MNRDPRRWLILVVLCLSTLVLVIDNMVLNVAIPPLTEDLGASSQDIQWIMESYMLVFAGLLLIAGSLSDRFGRRRIMVLGLVLFGAASLLGTFADSPQQLIAARVAMGVGGALIMPSTLSILITVFDERERRTAMTAWSAVAMVGMVGGPVVGGFLIAHFSWGSVFLINVPVAAVAIVAALVLMPESKGPWRKADPLGAVLSIIGMTSLVWAINGVPAHGLGAPETLGALVVAAVAMTAFLLWETRVESPMVPLGLFRDRNFSGASFSLVLVSFGNGGVLLAATQYLQFVHGYTPTETGLAFLPMAIAMLVVNGGSASLGRRLGNRPMLAAGLLVIAAGFGVLASIDPGDGFGVMMTALVLMGVGAGLAMPAAVSALMGAVVPDHAGVGSALNDTVQQSGAALGVAVLGSLMAADYADTMPDSAPAQAHRSLPDALALAARTADAHLADTARDAFTTAMSTSFLAGAVASVLAAVVAYSLIRDTKTPAPDPAPEATAPTAEPVH